MRVIAALILTIFIGLMSLPGQAAPVSVKSIRMWQAPDHTRLVFDLSGPLKHKVFTLHNPDRIVIDIQQASLSKPFPKLQYDGPILKNVRTGQRPKGELRIVFDLKHKSLPRAFVLKPFQDYGYRLVLDLAHGAAKNLVPEKPLATKEKPQAPAVTQKPPTPVRKPMRQKNIIIAIDAGHGGEDPGAIGRRYRTYEKRVVLNIARDLKRLVDKEPGLKAMLTRRGDYFVPLPKRALMAQEARASVFISIHADSLPRKRARGASVYALSQKGSTSRFAKHLAEQGNVSDFIGGVSKSEDPLVHMVLVDMNQTTTIVDSLALGRDIIRTLAPVGHLHSRKVEQAGFVVLKSPVVPSVLIETAFISNPAEEKKLRTRYFQKRMARGIFNGIKRYVKRKGLRPSPRSTASLKRNKRQYVVRRGDTLSQIARRYGVNAETIRLANNKGSTKLKAGERLLIPR